MGLSAGRQSRRMLGLMHTRNGGFKGFCPLDDKEKRDEQIRRVKYECGSVSHDHASFETGL